jgi:hypothetical protein
MPAFSRRHASTRASLACFLTALLVACRQADLPEAALDAPPPRPEIRVAHAIDPGAEGQSRDLLQHYIARDFGTPESRIPDGPALEREAVTWELPFKSKRIVAVLLTTVARDRLQDLPIILHPDATWGLPDPRRLRERPIFADDDGEAFIAALRIAALRMPENATYSNPTNFVMGLQEHIRGGSEPMWAFYEQGFDRILFRFRAIGGRAWIDYVGFNVEPPTSEPDYDAVFGPAPPMSPALRKDDGSVMHNMRPRSMTPDGKALPPRPRPSN